MSKKTGKTLGCAVAVIVVFITLPVGFYLQYQILSRVEATDLMWFLFWVQIPASLLIQLISQWIKYAFEGKDIFGE